MREREGEREKEIERLDKRFKTSLSLSVRFHLKSISLLFFFLSLCLLLCFWHFLCPSFSLFVSLLVSPTFVISLTLGFSLGLSLSVSSLSLSRFSPSQELKATRHWKQKSQPCCFIFSPSALQPFNQAAKDHPKSTENCLKRPRPEIDRRNGDSFTDSIILLVLRLSVKRRSAKNIRLSDVWLKSIPSKHGNATYLSKITNAVKNMQNTATRLRVRLLLVIGSRFRLD